MVNRMQMLPTFHQQNILILYRLFPLLQFNHIALASHVPLAVLGAFIDLVHVPAAWALLTCVFPRHAGMLDCFTAFAQPLKV